ncbi:MAG TPA: hypothetical protein VH682_10880, partial [Gemmataceae bacterium]
KVKLDDGRRTETAYVPPRESQRAAEPPPKVENPDKVLHQLRVLADPDVTGVSHGFHGTVTSTGQPVLPSRMKAAKKADPTPDDRTLYQTRVKPFVQSAMDVTAQAVLSSDRRYVRLSMTPVFNTMTGVQTLPIVVNPTIPGVR